MLFNRLNLSIFRLDCKLKNCLTMGLVLSAICLTACQSTSVSRPQSKQSQITPHPEQPIQTATPIQQLTPLQGTLWQIIEIKGRVAASYTTRAWMQLSNQTNRIEGSTGCNRLWGDYTLAANQAIKLRGFNGQQNCTGALVQEANLLDAFDQAIGYRLDAAGLVLLDRQQNILLRATATEPHMIQHTQ